MAWSEKEEYSLVVMYQENKPTAEISRLLHRTIKDIGDKLLELGLNPVTRPIEQNMKCPNCSADSENLKLLDFGITTGKWFYKCVKCEHVFQTF